MFYRCGIRIVSLNVVGHPISAKSSLFELPSLLKQVYANSNCFTFLAENLNTSWRFRRFPTIWSQVFMFEYWRELPSYSKLMEWSTLLLPTAIVVCLSFTTLAHQKFVMSVHGSKVVVSVVGYQPQIKTNPATGENIYRYIHVRVSQRREIKL